MWRQEDVDGDGDNGDDGGDDDALTGWGSIFGGPAGAPAERGGSGAVAEQATDRLERVWSFFLPGGKPTADLSIRWKLFRSGTRAIRTAGSRWEGYPDEETTWGPLTSG